MAIETTVWAFQPLKELKGETGFVVCDHDLADKLIAAGKVQDTREGALHFKEIQSKPEKQVEETPEVVETPVEEVVETPEVAETPKKKAAKDEEGDK